MDLSELADLANGPIGYATSVSLLAGSLGFLLRQFGIARVRSADAELTRAQAGKLDAENESKRDAHNDQVYQDLRRDVSRVLEERDDCHKAIADVRKEALEAERQCAARALVQNGVIEGLRGELAELRRLLETLGIVPPSGPIAAQALSLTSAQEYPARRSPGDKR